MEYLLWQSTTKPIRYFFVPIETEVHTGGYEIENSDGEKFSVDIEDILKYEISEKRADKIMEKELESLLTEFNSVLGGLAKLGQQMTEQDLWDEDDSDYDSEDDSSYDSEDDSDYDSDEDSSYDSEDDSDYDSDEDSSYDSEDDSDYDSEDDLDGLLSSLLSDIEGPLNALKGTINSQFSALEKELEELGGKLEEGAKEEDPKAFLRELGQRLIQLAEEKSSEEPVEEESESKDNSDDREESEDEIVVIQAQEGEEQSPEDTPAEKEASIPSSVELNKMKKAELLELATALSLAFSTKSTKKDIIEGIENCR